jgi:hypothetical protein
MSKIKLSILLLISFFVFSCSNNQFNNSNQKYSLAYIGGEYDGLLLKNYLMGSLKSLDMYDQNSNFEIKSSINHGSDLFITNIDNTSDREKINTNLSIKIINKKSNCVVYDYEINVSQFYIYASSEKFLSNRVAVKKIKKDNTEIKDT